MSADPLLRIMQLLNICKFSIVIWPQVKQDKHSIDHRRFDQCFALVKSWTVVSKIFLPLSIQYKLRNSDFFSAPDFVRISQFPNFRFRIWQFFGRISDGMSEFRIIVQDSDKVDEFRDKNCEIRTRLSVVFLR